MLTCPIFVRTSDLPQIFAHGIGPKPDNGYDADGNLIYKTDARGTQTTYTYEALNRLTKKQYSDTTPTVYFNYDGNTQTGCTASLSDIYPKGARTGMCDGTGGSEAWSHDQMGRVLSDQRTTNSVAKTTSYTYSPYVDGLINKIIYPSNLAITYAYDGAERPTSAADATGNTYASSATYAPQGALQAATLDKTSNFAGFTVSNSYTKRLQPNEIKVLNGGSTVMDFSDCFYALSGGSCPSTGTTDNGNVMAVINNGDPTRSQTFSYDALDRISVAGTVNTTGTNCWGEQYGYDTWGNLKTIGFPSQYNSSCAQPDNLNLGVSTTTNQINSPSGYVYDLAGNLTAIPNGGGSYSYNAENQLTSTANVNYTYDGDGKRIEKSNGTLYWYGMSSDVLEETNLSGALTNDYVFLGGLRLARKDASGNIFGYFADHLGSSRRVEEVASGGSTASLSYDADFYPFGRSHEFTNTSDPIHKFTGKERDSESGLDNFGARYFGSSMGRFMSPDPPLMDQHINDPQSWNLYAYVRNNPLSSVDPTGHAVELLGDEEQRKKELALLQKSLGNKDAASKLYINEVKDGDKTRYFVGIKGDVGDFMKMGETSHDLANLVQNKNVVEFGLTNSDLSRFGGAVTYEKGEVGNQNVRVLVNPSQADVADSVLNPNTILGASRFGGQNQDPRWRVNPFTPEIMTWHEFGHGWGQINGRPADRTNPEAIQWENRMREQLYGQIGPNNAPRVSH